VGFLSNVCPETRLENVLTIYLKLTFIFDKIASNISLIPLLYTQKSQIASRFFDEFSPP
jgi:hypothetical protein